MQGDIIAAKIFINTKGELNFFQISIPDDVQAITGIVAEIRGFSIAPFPLTRLLAGTLKLQSEQLADICYSCQLFIGNNGIRDIITGFTYAGGTIADLYPSVYSGSTFRDVQPVRIPGCHVLFGCFEDEIGKLIPGISYEISLHLYTERY